MAPSRRCLSDVIVFDVRNHPARALRRNPLLDSRYVRNTRYREQQVERIQSLLMIPPTRLTSVATSAEAVIEASSQSIQYESACEERFSVWAQHVNFVAAEGKGLERTSRHSTGS